MSEGQGSISYSSQGSGSGTTPSTGGTQFYFTVGGNNNFATLPGPPVPPVAGATSFTSPLIAGKAVRMSRGGLWQMGIDPGTGNTFFTKVTASNTMNFPALGNGEEIIIETTT